MKNNIPNKIKVRLRTMIPILLTNIDELFPKKVVADRARAILQLIFFSRQRMKENSKYAGGISRESGYCPVQARHLKKIAVDYVPIIRELKRHEIIQVRRNESTGKESYIINTSTKLYRINPKLTHCETTDKSYRWDYITHPDVIRAVSNHYHSSYKKQVEILEAKSKVYSDIVRYSESFSLDELKLQSDINKGIIEDGDSLVERAYRINDALHRWCTVDNYGYRIHTYLGNMPKTLRPYIVKREAPSTPLVMVDIANSQAFFLGVLFVNPELINLVPEFSPIKAVLEANCQQNNMRAFYEDCANNLFYDRCAAMFNDGDKKSLKDRSSVKLMVFEHIFYGSVGNYHKNPEKRAERQRIITNFKMLYPSVYDNMVKLKRTKKHQLKFLVDYYTEAKKPVKMFTTPNCLAQRIESKILIEIVAKTMFSIGRPVFTIHDAFLVEECHLEALNQVLEQVFSYVMGVKPPKTHITYLHHSETIV